MYTIFHLGINPRWPPHFGKFRSALCVAVGGKWAKMEESRVLFLFLLC